MLIEMILCFLGAINLIILMTLLKLKNDLELLYGLNRNFSKKLEELKKQKTKGARWQK